MTQMLASINDKTVTPPPLLESSMAKEKVRNKRKINANISDVKKPQKNFKQAKADVLKESTDKFLQIMEDSKKRDEDIFTKFSDFVSASDKRNADITLKLMEGFGNILSGGGGGGVSESMDGQGCAILALEVVPKNLIFT